MFSSGPNYAKLKTNLRLAVNRLKLLEKKKTELALKARKEIADYISDGKIERAKIRVEHIIREDYIVEAMELVEMYCDLLLARFGLLQQMKELDEGLAEAISSLIWVAPRLQADAAELKLIGDQLISKYGKPYGIACQDNTIGTVSAKLMQKMSVHAPPKVLVEKYLIEIAANYNVNYEPDQKILDEAEAPEDLIELEQGGGNGNGQNNLGGGASGGGGGGGGGGAMAHPQQPGFTGYPYMPMPPGEIPPQNNPAAGYRPFQYPAQGCVPADEVKVPLGDEPTPFPSPFGPNIPPNGGGGPGTVGYPQVPGEKEMNFNYPGGMYNGGGNYFNPMVSLPPPYSPHQQPPAQQPQARGTQQPQSPAQPKPNNDPNTPVAAPRKNSKPITADDIDEINFPELPDLPPMGNSPAHSKPGPNNGNKNKKKDDDIDFDDLAKRFEDLKKRK